MYICISETSKLEFKITFTLGLLNGGYNVLLYFDNMHNYIFTKGKQCILLKIIYDGKIICFFN